MSKALERVYERVLVLRCQTGDGIAFAELVERYHPRLRAFVGQMLGDVHAADDVLQEAWFDVFRSIGKLKVPAAFEAWVFRIARDRAYRVLRRKGIATEPLDRADEQIPDRSDAGDVELDADERRMVRSAVARLPHPQREVLILRFVEQMSYEQIASAVGCEVGTVRSRLHYARLAMRKLVERNDDEQQR